MMSLIDGYGVPVAVTVLMLDNVKVTQVKSEERGDQVDALQVRNRTKVRRNPP